MTTGADEQSLVQRFGSARTPRLAATRVRPDGVSDETVAALGQLSKALETAEDARGNLVAFHRLSGRADLELQAAINALSECGLVDLAHDIDEVLVGRGVVGDDWTYQLLEQYDDGYLDVFRAVEATARQRSGVPRHLTEAEMQSREQRRHSS